MAFKNSLLTEILQQKAEEIELLKGRHSLDQLKDRALAYDPLPFVGQIKAYSFPAIIAEIKRASPSKGWIRQSLDPKTAAKDYCQNGAACLSILTDEKYFAGSPDFIPCIRDALPGTPILRKDFIIDPIQIWETRALGADALLLIIAALDPSTLQDLLRESAQACLSVLLEVHTAEELEIALAVLGKNGPVSHVMLGINNRNLHTFQTDLSVTLGLMDNLSHRCLRLGCSFTASDLLVVAESGIKSAEDIMQLSRSGVSAFLIGESLLRSGEPGENLKQLIDNSRAQRENGGLPQ